MKQIWDTEDLASHWSLSLEEIQLLKSKPARNHLAFVSQLKFYRNTGRFPGSTTEIPPTVIHYLMQQYDEMIKYAAALKKGTADPESILRRFTRNNVQHPTYRALAELGKAVKTLFLCRYIGSEALRQVRDDPIAWNGQKDPENTGQRFKTCPEAKDGVREKWLRETLEQVQVLTTF